MIGNEKDKSLSNLKSQIKISESVLHLNNLNTDSDKIDSLSRGTSHVPTEKDIIEENLIFDYKYFLYDYIAS